MRKVIPLIVFCFVFLGTAYAQNTDSLISLIYKEKTDSARIRRIYDVIEQYGSMNPVKAMEVQQQLLALTKKQRDRVAEAVVSAELGYQFNMAGSTVQAKRLLLEALKTAEATGNPQAIGIVYQNLAVFTRDRIQYRQLHEKAMQYSTLAGDHLFICWELMHLCKFYSEPDHLQLDSALYYAEKGYRLAMAKKKEGPLLGLLLCLARIQQKLGNNGLALEYIRTAERLPRNNEERCPVYSNYTIFYRAIGRPDSAFFYAYKNLDCAKRTFIFHMKAPANALRLLYAGKNADSALKYTNLYDSIKDSLLSVQAVQQVQAMDFEENLRQEKLETERHNNLQYAAIALGLVVFAILFLLLSHSVIASARVIKNLGIFSILIVFEFANLLIHPYLGELTHHSPVMMLGFMVCLAALLIPLHHKVEHWITHKMVEKNNKIRLAKAKKTIAELEETV
jgi:hypothetical protein